VSEALLHLYLRREPGGYKYDEDRTVCRHEISGSSRRLGCKFCLVGNPHLIPSRARRVINMVILSARFGDHLDVTLAHSHLSWCYISLFCSAVRVSSLGCSCPLPLSVALNHGRLEGAVWGSSEIAFSRSHLE